MRISTAHAYDASIEQLTQRQSELGDAQLRLTSGKRVARASDDPINAARAERALAGVSRATASQRSVEASRSAMTQIEGALGDAGDLLQQRARGDRRRRQRELRRQPAQDPGRTDSRPAPSVAGGRQRSDGAGGYLFGGQGSSAPPFVDAAGGVQYCRHARRDQRRRRRGPADDDGRRGSLDVGADRQRRVRDAQRDEQPAAPGSTPAASPTRPRSPARPISLQFSVAAGVTTYSVLEDGAPTALTDVRFVSGQAIQFDGMAVTVNGAPAAGDAFEIAPVAARAERVRRARQGGHRPGHAAARHRREGAGDGDNLRNIDAVLARMSGARATRGRGAEPDRQHGRAARHGQSATARPNVRRPRTWTCRRRSRTSRTSRAATMRRSGPTRRCSGCRCSTTSIHDRRQVRLIRDSTKPRPARSGAARRRAAHERGLDPRAGGPVLLALHRPPSCRHRDPADGVSAAARRRARRSPTARGSGAGVAGRRRQGVAQRAQREPARRPAADARRAPT